jgi:hypothetical protein
VSSHTGQTSQTHRSDRSGAATSPYSVLQSWLCGSTKEPSGILVNHWKLREIGVASAKLHSWLGSHVVPARPWFWGSTKKPSMSSSFHSCHPAARTWLRWPPGPSNGAYLSSPHLEASPATTFLACSWPAPTLVRPQPARAIPNQELVYTTLSITHHTRKWPSTGPRTTHGPQILTIVTELKQPASYLLNWSRIYYKKDSNSTTSYILQKGFKFHQYTHPALQKWFSRNQVCFVFLDFYI